MRSQHILISSLQQISMRGKEHNSPASLRQKKEYSSTQAEGGQGTATYRNNGAASIDYQKPGPYEEL